MVLEITRKKSRVKIVQSIEVIACAWRELENTPQQGWDKQRR